MTWLFTDPLCVRHDNGPSHPESPNRYRRVEKAIKDAGLDRRCLPGKAHLAELDSIRLVHPAAYLDRVIEMCRKGGGHLDEDTPVVPASHEVALSAAGTLIAAVDAILTPTEQEGKTNAFCVVRPPGHHATPEKPMGFCLYNNVAIAARHAQKKYGLEKVLIIDWDVHHGNGTQDIFWDDPTVFFLSIHRYGMGFYPGTGSEGETGGAKARGTTLNVPLTKGVSRKGFLEAFQKGIERAAAHKPQLVLLSAGFDACRADPVGDLGLEPEDYGPMTEMVKAVAAAHCGSKLVSVLEGGYNLDQLSQSAVIHLESLLKK